MDLSRFINLCLKCQPPCPCLCHPELLGFNCRFLTTGSLFSVLGVFQVVGFSCFFKTEASFGLCCFETGSYSVAQDALDTYRMNSNPPASVSQVLGMLVRLSKHLPFLVSFFPPPLHLSIPQGPLVSEINTNRCTFESLSGV